MHALLVAALSAALTLACFAASRLASARLLPAYRSLPPHLARDLDSRAASTLHAVGVTAAAAALVPALAAAPGPLTLATSPGAAAALAASAGYFGADAALIVAHWPALGGADMVAHHAAALASLAVSLATAQGHALVLLLLACEVTTPFVNARAALDRAGAKATRAYAANGLALLAAWGAVRVAGMGAFLAYLASARGRADAGAMAAAPRALLYVVPPGLYALNVAWFLKIGRGAAKMLASRRAAAAATAAAPPTPATPPPAKPAAPAAAGRPALAALNLWPPSPAAPSFARLSPPAAALASLSAACRLGAERAPGVAAAWARRTAAAAGF